MNGGSGKSADAFRTIGEAAEELRLPQHVLRFWETKFTQIRPMKRAGGRRFYRPEDVELLGAIRQLLYGEGYTIKGVQRILKEQGPRAVSALARERQEAEPPEPEPATMPAPVPLPTREAEPTRVDDELAWLQTPARPPPPARPPRDDADGVARRLHAALEEIAALRGMLAVARR